jgi:hypothetical protein
MNHQISSPLDRISDETVQSPRHFLRPLNDTVAIFYKAADGITSDDIALVSRDSVANGRRDIRAPVCHNFTLRIEQPITEGTWLNRLHSTWTSIRARLNGGDSKAVVIKARRPDELILDKFREGLPLIAGTLVGSELLNFLHRVYAGLVQIIVFRNLYLTALVNRL